VKLSKESAYGIGGLMVLAASPPGTTMLLSDIARRGTLPQSFLAKTFQKLARHGIVRSFRGSSTRGYVLTRPPREIKLGEILLAIEGPDLFERCIFWSDRCADTNPCPLHEYYKSLSEALNGRLMERVTLADLLKQKPGGSRAAHRSFVKSKSRRP
jgi:Rrf2 family protein